MCLWRIKLNIYPRSTIPVCRVYILLEFGQASGICKIPCLPLLLENALTKALFFFFILRIFLSRRENLLSLERQ